MARAPKLSTQERQWRAQDALRTLTEADRIRGDRALMADVQKHASQQIKTLQTVAKPAPAAKPKPKAAAKPRATATKRRS